MAEFTDEEIAHCKAAMSKPAPMDVLRLLASGRAVVEHTRDRRELFLVELDGRKILDAEHPTAPGALLAGSWPLYRAGMIDDLCQITEAGLTALKGDGHE